MLLRLAIITLVANQKSLCVSFLTPYFKGKKSQIIFLLVLCGNIDLDLKIWRHNT